MLRKGLQQCRFENSSLIFGNESQYSLIPAKATPKLAISHMAMPENSAEVEDSTMGSCEQQPKTKSLGSGNGENLQGQGKLCGFVPCRCFSLSEMCEAADVEDFDHRGG
jgi:hypothetical protein